MADDTYKIQVQITDYGLPTEEWRFNGVVIDVPPSIRRRLLEELKPAEEESECMVGSHPPACRGHIKENEK